MAKYYYPLESIPHEYGEIVSWISEICRSNKINDFVTVDHNPDNNSFCFNLYTKDYAYRIVARPYSYTKKELKIGKEIGPSNVPPYLGATVSTRKPRAGEDWTRGNDLADGPYSKDTWEKIKNDIIGYELVKVSKPKEHTYNSFGEMKTVPETPYDVKEINDLPINSELNCIPKGGCPTVTPL
jgi:hypothetical protein